MASGPSNQPARGGDPVPSDQLIVNLQVVSPSVGINRPLLFPGLAATTTIKQLKEKIRQLVLVRPSDENQRLIHRGRALLRDTDSLLDVFGADALREPDQQTIHLVIRDVSDSSSSTPPLLPGTQSPAPGNQPPNVPRQNPPHPYLGSHLPPGMTRRTPFQNTSAAAPPQARIPSPARPHSPAHTPEQAAAFQQQHQNMTHWLTHLQREAMARAVILNQNQRERAQMGMRGIGDPALNTAPQRPEANSGRASPAPTQTIYRETIGPNGHSYHVETIIRAAHPTAAAPSPQAGFSPTDIHNIMRAADSNQAQNSIASALQQNGLRRSASNNSLHNRPLNQPGITTSVFANGGSRASSGRATPDHLSRSAAVPGVGQSFPTLVPSSSQSRQGTEVYILSSPEGPRGLLINNTTGETYYTPRMLMQPSYPQLRNAPSFPSLLHTIQTQTRDDASPSTPQVDQRQPTDGQQHDTTAQPQQQQNQQQQQQQQQQQDPQPRVLPLHPNNPVAVGLTALLMQVLPHLWLMIRLILFVWFFTSPNSSWSRWLTIISLAAFVFALSTGLLAGLADHAWRPLGRHLENIFPAADPDRNRREGAGEGEERNQNIDPAQLAARLVTERRERESWLMGQLRRLERAGLLFLASIAPGVAERHIANFEAEARVREHRRRQAEAANAAAAAEAEAAAATDAARGETQDEGNSSSEIQAEDNSADQSGEQVREAQQGAERNEQLRGGIVAL